MRGSATLLRGSPRGSGYPGSEAGAPAEGSGNPEFRLHSPSVPSEGSVRGRMVVEAMGKASLEGLAGRLRGGFQGTPRFPRHPQILSLPPPRSPLVLPRTWAPPHTRWQMRGGLGPGQGEAGALGLGLSPYPPTPHENKVSNREKGESPRSAGACVFRSLGAERPGAGVAAGSREF